MSAQSGPTGCLYVSEPIRCLQEPECSEPEFLKKLNFNFYIYWEMSI